MIGRFFIALFEEVAAVLLAIVGAVVVGVVAYYGSIAALNALITQIAHG